MDNSLKTYHEWCEWCKCIDCGGKVIPKHLRKGYDETENHSTSSAVLMSDITGELVLFIVLLIGASWGEIYSFNTPYKQIHVIGVIFFAITAARIGKIVGF